MVNDNTMVQVRNLTDQTVVYLVKETGTRRVFAPFETKTVSARELRDLWFVQGGNRLLQNYLHVDNPGLAGEFGISEDEYTHEYSWTKEDIDRVLQEGSLDELLDAFDFAPMGICETLASRAVELRIADRNKCDAIRDATGRDITQMIEFEEYFDREYKDEDDDNTRAKARRVGNDNKTEEPAPRRRRA